MPAPERVWIPVPPRADSLVVNLGGELERWSNGRFKATLHCVVNETGRERFSLPFFFEPNLDAAIEPLPGTGEPQKRRVQTHPPPQLDFWGCFRRAIQSTDPCSLWLLGTSCQAELWGDAVGPIIDPKRWISH